ncbi:hypothetical protein SDRG_06685 [Saprolegnia diclina VS20]|uniref:Uncharacterized protein n=1 Tax=Saprolegnia diclina (strain VS20) TaxID=1156394 RepID=T0QQ29_SAPDV|nr:hypothetical protein SDRG_06685 [Saprolegnia diclina VS20]EQC35940.1 hypothetical protein SDRG_06685 [Saprolegnia diclina VS20]|eukprot:XP_008610702.1 hypothetical protein SDRG_06685 [Saprolegnia diclina VS20]
MRTAYGSENEETNRFLAGPTRVVIAAKPKKKSSKARRVAAAVGVTFMVACAVGAYATLGTSQAGSQAIQQSSLEASAIEAHLESSSSNNDSINSVETTSRPHGRANRFAD